jgi:RNA polymerase sigma-70 factor (ECF subfamily)
VTDSRTDERLLLQALDGDTAAYDVLMRRHFRGAFAVALAHVRDPDLAEDICQEAFFRAFRQLATCREPSKFAAWLLRIVRNQALNTRAYEQVRHHESIATFEPMARQTASTAVERDDLRRDLLRALGTLSPTRREVVLLHDLEDWTHAAIAHALGISEVMSRRHLTDARRALRALLPHLASGFEHE